MLIYRVTSNFVAAKNIGSLNPHEQHILDTLDTFSKFNKVITAQSVRRWIKRKYRSQLSESIICEYLGLYVALEILESWSS